jgi:hypothetical protein
LSSNPETSTGLTDVCWTKTTVGGPSYLGGSVTWPPLPPFPLGWLSSPPMAAPLQGFLLPLDLPLRSKDREEEEHVELKGKRGSRRCSSPSLLTEFLGETLGMDEILVPPCNYVLLEVVDHGD